MSNYKPIPKDFFQDFHINFEALELLEKSKDEPILEAHCDVDMSEWKMFRDFDGTEYSWNEIRESNDEYLLARALKAIEISQDTDFMMLDPGGS